VGGPCEKEGDLGKGGKERQSPSCEKVLAKQSDLRKPGEECRFEEGGGKSFLRRGRMALYLGKRRLFPQKERSRRDGGA